MRRENAAVFGGFFLLGLWQAAPSVTTGDAGEFAAAAATLGVAHAPGYPAYALAARAWGAAVPLGNWAYRTNLFSAACGAAALALFVDLLRRFGAGRAARLGAALLLGLAPSWREQSAVTEVFAPHLLLAALLLWIVAAADERLLEPGPAGALGLAFGFACGNHQTVALVLPALLLAGRGRSGRWPTALAAAAAGAAAGACLHAALPLRALRAPPLNWDDAVTPEAFWRLITRRDYGTLALTTDGAQSGGPEALAAQAWRSARGLHAQLGTVGAALAVLGAAAWRRAGLKLPPSAAWAWVLAAGPMFLMLGRPPFDPQTSSALERFHLLPLLGAGVFAAAGLEILSRARPALGVAAAAAAAVALAPSAWAQSRRGDFLAHDYGRTLLRELPRGTRFVMDGGDDTFYSLSFLTFAQGLRRDLSLHDRGGVVFRGSYGPDFLSLTRDEKEARRRAVEGAWADAGSLRYSTLNPGLLPGRALPAAGLIRRPLPPGAPFPERRALDETLNSPRAPDAAARYRDRALLAFVHYQRGAAALESGEGASGVAWLETAAATGGDALWVAPTISYALAVHGYEATQSRNWPDAERTYRALAGLDPKRAEPLTDLGVVLQRTGRAAEAEAAMRAGLARDARSAHAWEALGGLLWAQSRFGECADAYASAAVLPGAQPSDAGWSAAARRRAAR